MKKNEEQGKRREQNEQVEIFGISEDFNGDIHLASSLAREGINVYILPVRLSEFGFNLRINKNKVFRTAKAAINAYIDREIRNLEYAKESIEYHKKNIVKATKLYAHRPLLRFPPSGERPRSCS